MSGLARLVQAAGSPRVAVRLADDGQTLLFTDVVVDLLRENRPRPVVDVRLVRSCEALGKTSRVAWQSTGRCGVKTCICRSAPRSGVPAMTTPPLGRLGAAAAASPPLEAGGLHLLIVRSGSSSFDKRPVTCPACVPGARPLRACGRRSTPSSRCPAATPAPRCSARRQRR